MDAETKEAVRQLFHSIIDDYAVEHFYTPDRLGVYGSLDTITDGIVSDSIIHVLMNIKKCMDERFAAQETTMDSDDKCPYCGDSFKSNRNTRCDADVYSCGNCGQTFMRDDDTTWEGGPGEGW